MYAVFFYVDLDTTYNVSPISEFSICRYACVVRVSCTVATLLVYTVEPLSNLNIVGPD